MSDTTSTNISVAQANSAESTQAGSTRLSHLTETGSTKRICFYKSGDPRFNGIKMVVTNRSFKTFDALLDNLSKKVPLPFGVRNIMTPRGLHRVTNLEELEDGKSYVCSHQKKIKPINLEKAKKKPLLWQSSRPISARRRTVQLTRQNVVAPFQRQNTIVIGNAKKLVIFKNGDSELKQSLILNKKATHNFESLLDQITEVMQCPVFKLYSTDGRRILSMNAVLLSSGTIVAAGREPFKPANYDSEREFLPNKLPGISSRVFPKSKSKPEMKTPLETDENIFACTNGQEYSLSSDKTWIKGNNVIDYSYIPQNEISLTEHWPNSGEELPVISPGDNIEKSVHFNSDGTMTVEMKVRFKIKEDETINWSTTVSRSDLSYCKRRLRSSLENPHVQLVGKSETGNNLQEVPTAEGENDYKSVVESYQSEVKNPEVNLNLHQSFSSNKEKTNFYRPPTPGLRRTKTQERRIFLKNNRRVSEGNIKEQIRNISYSKENEQDEHHFVGDIADQQIKAFPNHSDWKHDRDNSERIVMRNSNRTVMSTSVKEESFKLSDTTSKELLQGNIIGKTFMRKCDFTSERNDCVAFPGTNQRDRPHTSGKHISHPDEFKFKEIKRSVSASVTFSESSKLSKEESHGKEGSVEPDGSTVTQMAMSPHCECSCETQLVTTDYPSNFSRDQIKSTLGENDSVSSDNQSAKSTGEKKKNKYIRDKIKQKDHNKNEEINYIECISYNRAHLSNNCCDSISAASSMLFDSTKCAEEIQTVNMITAQEFLSTSLLHSNVDTVKKLKGNKQMAEVKPRSIKKINESMISHDDKNESTKIEKEISKDYTTTSKGKTVYNDSLPTGDSIVHPNDKIQYPVTNHHQKKDQMPRKSAKMSKNDNKLSKKQNPQKKKTKNNKQSGKIKTGISESLGTTQATDYQVVNNTLDSYVQNWLKNILPNVPLPIIHMQGKPFISSTSNQDDNSDEMKKLNENSVNVNTSSKPMSNGEKATGRLETIQFESTTGKDMFIQQNGSLDEDTFSVLMDKSNDLTELFAQQITDFEYNIFSGGSKMEELIKWLTNYQIINISQKKASTDAAVQVEADEGDTEKHYSPKHDCNEGQFSQQLKDSPIKTQNAKSKHFEKSLSVPGSSSISTNSSSQLLLAWLIVLNVKQGMKHKQEDISQSSCTGSVIFTLLQSLKKIAIVERADDLKAAIIQLQESVFKHDLEVQNPTSICDKLLTNQRVPHVMKKSDIETENNTSNTINKGKIDVAHNMEDLCKKLDFCQNLTENNLLDENRDELELFRSPFDEGLSTVYCKNISSSKPENVEEHNDSVVKSDESSIKSLNYCFEKQNKSHGELISKSVAEVSSELLSSNLSQTCSISPTPDVESSDFSTKKISKVKKMVQELEQRKYPSQMFECQKCLQSPNSSDWSDYRQDSEESLHSDTLRTSSDILTESGEEQLQEKPHKTGFVKRAIERLYGKAESKPKSSSSPTFPVNNMNEKMVCSQTDLFSAKVNTLRSQPSSSKSLKMNTQEYKKNWFGGAIEYKTISQHCNSSHALKNKGSISKSDQETDGVLIDKGRWLLKENHLIRRSPPEMTSMYGHLDTTSADTFLDNTSDELPYPNSLCKMNQQLPLAEVSSSEIEDMVRPHRCHYFNMPHGSDSEPFSDASHFKSKIRPKTSGGVVRSKTHDTVSLESQTAPAKRSCEISGSFPSFTTVDLHFSENKVHPLLQSKCERANEGEPSSCSHTRSQVREQDSLDKLQVICGQHCPILTAVITPIYEENRGFAYRRSSDIENLMFLNYLTKNENCQQSINRGTFTDENNNVSRLNTPLFAKNFQKIYIKMLSLLNTKGVLQETKTNGNKFEKYILNAHTCLPLLMTNDSSTKQGYKQLANNVFPQFMYITNDENNNIIYHCSQLY